MMCLVHSLARLLVAALAPCIHALADAVDFLKFHKHAGVVKRLVVFRGHDVARRPPPAAQLELLRLALVGSMLGGSLEGGVDD